MITYRIFAAIVLLAAGFLFGGAAVSHAQTGQVFFVDVTVTKDLAVTPSLVRITAGEPGVFASTNPTYQAQLVSLDGAVLYTTAIPVDFRVYDSPTVTATSQVRLALKLPYFLTAQFVKLSKNGTVFGSIDLTQALCPAAPDGQPRTSSEPVRGHCSQFCGLKKVDPDCFRCGNGVCEPGESAATCPTDCSTALTPAPRPTADFTPLLALVILVLAGGGVAGWRYFRRSR